VSEASDHVIARRIADEAGEALLELREKMLRSGTSRWDLEAQGDIIAHQLIAQRLGQERPDDHVLSEEGADDRRRLGADRVWIVDPLDGTSPSTSCSGTPILPLPAGVG